MGTTPNLKYISNRNRISHLQNGSVPYITFSPLEGFDFIRHGFSTRFGGVSQGIFSSLNLTWKPPVGCEGVDAEPYVSGIEINNVKENFRRIGDAIGIPVECMVHGKQTHTNNVRIVTGADRGKGILLDADYDNIDGLVTNEPNIGLVTGHADCIPLYFVDPVVRAIGLSHSGWRGTATNIAEKTVRLMVDTYGCNPKDIIGIAGPGICGSCYEVSADVAKQFDSAVTTEKNDGKFLLALHMANRLNMLGAGLSDEHIFVSDVCTMENDKLLFSHRATGGRRGGCCAFLAITE